MPQVAPPLPEQSERFPNRVRWTKSQYRAIVEAGILTGRYELIDGDTVSKMSQKHHLMLTLSGHSWAVCGITQPKNNTKQISPSSAQVASSSKEEKDTNLPSEGLIA